MREGRRALNLIANPCPRAKYPARFMASHAKHPKLNRRQKERPPQGRAQPHKTNSISRLASRPAPAERDLDKTKKQPLSPKLPKNDKLKTPALDGAKTTRVSEAAAEETHGHRGRERSSYDGD